MAEQISTRELLQGLTDAPLGSKELQKAQMRRGTNGAALPEVLEVAKRCTKIWLPQGRKPPRPRRTCNEPTAEQADIEDAVEAAGGRRGGKAPE